MTHEQHIDSLRQQVLAAAAARRPLRIRGGGTKDWYGAAAAAADTLLDMRSLSGIIDYEPTELVITARSGTPLVEIEAALREHNQMLAFEPPHFGAGATLGGVVAAGLSGPRRASSGAVRDFVLGAVLMDGRGEVLNFGGQVMKNVAGYDVSRLLAGSMGTLGVMLQHSIKVLPRPVATATLRFAMSEIDALARLNTWAGQPLPVSASCWHDGVLTVRLEGAAAAVDAAIASFGGERLSADGADAFWTALREHSDPYFKDASQLWRLSVPPAAGALVLDGEQLIEWGGAQRWLKLPAIDSADTTDNALARAARIRASVRAAGGHATLFRQGAAGRAGVPVFEPLAPAIARVHERLQQAFDPAHIFNPGRLF
ncbi:glycolate oxidase subunit GlcE [Massilia sp. PWRC2]|uniref:glycolate oxidase subunit GlcE n=1 Tax=Massilia sp. PWRC2 TaxID=2804626 RepID=UPI003CE7427C